MNGIGILKSSGIELVDATIKDGSVMPSQCPGGLGISCSACPHAWTADAASVTKKKKKEKPFPFLLCRWHDSRQVVPASAPGAPG